MNLATFSEWSASVSRVQAIYGWQSRMLSLHQSIHRRDSFSWSRHPPVLLCLWQGCRYIPLSQWSSPSGLSSFMYFYCSWWSLSLLSITDVMALYMVFNSVIGLWSLAVGFSDLGIIKHLPSVSHCWEWYFAVYYFGECNCYSFEMRWKLLNPIVGDLVISAWTPVSVVLHTCN